MSGTPQSKQAVVQLESRTVPADHLETKSSYSLNSNNKTFVEKNHVKEEPVLTSKPE